LHQADAVLSRRPTQFQHAGLRQQVNRPEKITDLPGLFPVITIHRDMPELSDPQVSHFREWRQQHYAGVLDFMNEIIKRRVDLREVMLDAQVDPEGLPAKPGEVCSLQEAVFRMRLSCREIIVRSFPPSHRDGPAFALEDCPAYAGLLD
jgi:hypothetical protein